MKMKQPIPEKGETKKVFLNRCKSSVFMIQKYFMESFRCGVCEILWNNAHKTYKVGSGFGPLEKYIQKKVREHAKKTYGILSRKYSSPAQRSVPDCIFYFPGNRVIFIEFKRQGESPSANQWREINKLLDSGSEVYVIDNKEIGIALIDTIMREINHGI